MIDIHSHILPGIDDGARTMDEALEMVRAAASAGVTDMVATPHASEQYPFDAVAVERRLEDLQSAATGAVRIHYGCEMRLTAENIERALGSPGTYTIGHRGYLLVELSDSAIPKTLRQILGRFIGAGMRPIIAHPERNPLLQDRPEDLEKWAAEGCLFQVTAGSLEGRFGRTAEAVGREMLHRGCVHFLASDAHDPEFRPSGLRRAWEFVQSAFGPEVAERILVENPGAVLAGVSLPERVPVRKRSWFGRW